MTKYPNLLSPVKAGGVVLKNRILYSDASPHFLQGPETYPAESYRAYYSAMAKNAAVVTLAEWGIKPNQRSNDPSNWDDCHLEAFDMNDPSVHNYFSQLCDEVHFYGSKVTICFRIKMPAGFNLNPGRVDTHAPVPDMVDYKALPKELIPALIHDVVEKVRMYKNIGFDGVSLGLGSYLLPAKNPRKDEYGGEKIENRTRFIVEVIKAIKKEFPKNFFVEGILPYEDIKGTGRFEKMGYTADDCLEFCRLLDGLVDILQIREPEPVAHCSGYNFTKGHHKAVDFAARLKAEGLTKMILEPIGGFQDPNEMEKYLAEGKCDMFAMARGLMADYDYAQKLYEGRDDDIVPCLHCNKCHGVVKREGNNPWIPTCAVNPIFARSHKMLRLVPEAGEPRKVAVIGGGPAGMRAAIYAAERGHDVTLYEKSGVLGGQLIHSDYFSFKWPVRDYKDWMIAQLDKKGVRVILNCAPTREELAAEKYYAVIAATGASPRLPGSIKGLKDAEGNALYPTCLDILGKEKELGKSAIVVGASETGLETGMHLAEHGLDVTMLTRQDMVGHDASMLHSITMAWLVKRPNGEYAEGPVWEKYDNLHSITNATTLSVEGGTVTYKDKAGEIKTITADSVIICGGMEPRESEALAYAGVSDKYFIAGDCNGAGNLPGCVRDSFSAAMNI